jgi:hypothetical protein
MASVCGCLLLAAERDQKMYMYMYWPHILTVKPLAAPRLLASCQYAINHGNKPHAAHACAAVF